MAAQKVVLGHTAAGQTVGMDWAIINSERMNWHVGLEVEAALVGRLYLFVNPRFARAWVFKLLLHEEEVFQWHAKPIRSGHNNTGCPERFPRKVRSPDHEHVWVEGLGCYCAVPIKGFDLSTHERMFYSFCERTNLRFEPTYSTPSVQLSL